MMKIKTLRERGKRAERELARKLKGQRIGILGKEDISHPLFSIEVKSRVKCTVEKWLKQAEKNCRNDKIPLLIIHLLNKPHENDLVILRLKDFLSIFKEGGD